MSPSQKLSSHREEQVRHTMRATTREHFKPLSSNTTRIEKPQPKKSHRRTHSRKSSTASIESLSPQELFPEKCTSQSPASSPPTQEQASQQSKQNEQQQRYPSFANTKITATHILFWHGLLSNWHIGTSANRRSTFSGTRALQLLLPQLREAGIDHPSEDAISTRLLARHGFNCGEQFMMACKAWLFERDLTLESLTERYDQQAKEDLCRKVMAAATATASNDRRKSHPRARDNTISNNSKEADILRKLRAANPNLLAVLHTREPRQQKALGRKCKGFNENLWNVASEPVVVAACIARAERDSELRNIYQFATGAEAAATAASVNTPSTRKSSRLDTDNEQQSEDKQSAIRQTRTFVEGSPMDRIWGVGLTWNVPECDDERKWRGENRLGKCHDRAAEYIMGMRD